MDKVEIPKLIEYLERCRDNRGRMAALRSLLNRNLRARGWRAIAPVNGIGDLTKETVAGLYAIHPLHESQENYTFGTACRKLATASSKQGEPRELTETPFDRQFQQLLISDRESLCVRLVRVIRRMKAEKIPVNYANLAADLIYWGDSVRERWAQQYWTPVTLQKGAENVPE